MLNIILVVLVLIIFLVSLWYILKGVYKTYEKAGQPGWAFLVPFYGGWKLAEIAGKPGWWGLIAGLSTVNLRSNQNTKTIESIPPILYAIIIPLALLSIYFGVMISIGLARKFKKQRSFALLIIFAPFIAFPILGHGPAVYHKKA